MSQAHKRYARSGAGTCANRNAITLLCFHRCLSYHFSPLPLVYFPRPPPVHPPLLPPTCCDWLLPLFLFRFCCTCSPSIASRPASSAPSGSSSIAFFTSSRPPDSVPRSAARHAPRPLPPRPHPALARVSTLHHPLTPPLASAAAGPRTFSPPGRFSAIMVSRADGLSGSYLSPRTVMLFLVSKRYAPVTIITLVLLGAPFR